MTITKRTKFATRTTTALEYNTDRMATTEGSLLKQTLMSHGECFVYKVPPLATASGYRANDWNLASPLETCGFQVERRNNDLYLLFTLENHTKLFALSKIEGEGSSINNINVETVMDSSRYFVCKILQSNPNDATKKSRTALLGFGFREREIAIDLLGNLQQFRQSIDRELEAKDLASKTKAIPTLAEGEKIHISLPGGKGGKSTTVKSPKPKGSGTPVLLKKPPPGASAIDLPESPMSPFADGKRFSLSAMECPMTSMTLKLGPKTDTIDEKAPSGGDGSDDDSAAAQAHTVVDDLMSVEDDLEDVEADEGATNDDASEGAVGGATIADDSTTGSFQFSELNLDDLDDPKDDDDDNKEAAKEDDEDFGDFQGA